MDQHASFSATVGRTLTGCCTAAARCRESRPCASTCFGGKASPGPTSSRTSDSSRRPGLGPVGFSTTMCIRLHLKRSSSIRGRRSAGSPRSRSESGSGRWSPTRLFATQPCSPSRSRPSIASRMAASTSRSAPGTSRRNSSRSASHSSLRGWAIERPFGSAESLHDYLGRYREAGTDRFVFSFARRSPDGMAVTRDLGLVRGRNPHRRTRRLTRRRADRRRGTSGAAGLRNVIQSWAGQGSNLRPWD
jgi:hypothetical protein